MRDSLKDADMETNPREQKIVLLVIPGVLRKTKMKRNKENKIK